MPYRDMLKVTGPTILRGTNGTALSGETGGAIDDQQNRLLQGLLARFPTKGNVDANGAYGPPPSDAIDEQLTDRRLRRGPAETVASAGARVKAAWDQWDFAGSAWGVLRELQIAGYANMITVQDNGRYYQLTGSTGDPTTDLAFGDLMGCMDRGDAPGWMFDALEGAYWSQWGLLFTADAANLQTVEGQAILNSIAGAWGLASARFVGTWVELPPVSGTRRVLGWPTGRVLGGGGRTLGGFSTRFIPPDGSAAVVTGP